MSDTDLRDQLMTLLLAGHETTATALAWTFDLLLRHPRRAASACASRCEDGEDDYLRATITRVAAPAPGGPARRPAPGQGAGRRRPTPAGGHRRHPGDLARPHPRRRLPRALRLPPRALPRATARTPTPGSPSAAASAAASARAFAEFEMRIVLREVLDPLRAAQGRPASRSGSAAATSPSRPRDGTPVVLTARHPAREPSCRRLAWTGRGGRVFLRPARRSCSSRRSPRRRRGRGSAPRWCRSAPCTSARRRRGCPRSRASAGSRRRLRSRTRSRPRRVPWPPSRTDAADAGPRFFCPQV